jgi:predicted GNAT superfamily acetyltransferase
MTAVLEAYRDQGIGRRLKLFQRDDALARGISLIEWTFDPLANKNAHFNLMCLGAVARRYLPNAYGITTSPLHAALPTDRLVAQWHLQSSRVQRILAGKRPRPSFLKSSVRVTVPAKMETLKGSDPAAAIRLQSKIRAEFMRWFSKGYAATALASGRAGIDYVLEPWEPE